MGEDTDIKNSLMDTVGVGEREGREGECNGESDTETYITICNIDSPWEFAG